MPMLSPPPPFQSFYRPSPLPGSDLQVHALGVGEWMRPTIVDRPLGTGDWLFMAFRDDVVIRVGDSMTRVSAPSLMIWSRGRGHCYGNADTRWCHSWMHADGPAVTRALAEAATPIDRPLAVPTRILENAVAAIHDEVARENPPDAAIVELHLRALARAIARAANARTSRVPERWLAVRRELEDRSTQRLTLAGIARRAGCSIPHLCAEFQRWFGASPIDFVIRVRMRRALSLLHDRNRSVGTIAREVGYHDLHHFSKLFKKHHGAAPRELRRRMLATM